MGGKCIKEMRVVEGDSNINIIFEKHQISDKKNKIENKLNIINNTEETNDTKEFEAHSSMRKPTKKLNTVPLDVNVMLENQNFKVVKSDNKRLEDAKMIDKCLMRLFFVKTLDKKSR